MSNVIAFPKGKKDSPPQTIEELQAKVNETRKEHIDYIVEESMSFIFSRCYEEGFDLGQEECIKTTSLAVESFKAALYNTVGIKHPLHVLADGMFITESAVSLKGEFEGLTFEQADELTRPD